MKLDQIWLIIRLETSNSRWGSNLIVKSADKIDLHIETIDGKDTFHSVAWVVIQIVTLPIDHHGEDVMIARALRLLLPLTEETSSIIRCLPFRNPKKVETTRRRNAYTQIISSNVLNIKILSISLVFLKL